MGQSLGFTIILIILAALFVLALWAGGKAAGEPGNEAESYSLDTHRIYGQCRVLYNDGFLSQPFMIQTTKFYASHFGGRVVPRGYDGPHRIPPSGRWVNMPASKSSLSK